MTSVSKNGSPVRHYMYSKDAYTTQCGLKIELADRCKDSLKKPPCAQCEKILQGRVKGYEREAKRLARELNRWKGTS